MKIVTKYLIATIVLFQLFSCSEEPKKPKKEKMEIDGNLNEFLMMDLSTYELPATIYLPDETANIGASKPEISHLEGDFQWLISVGQNFKLSITDCGSGQTGSNRLKREKEDLSKIDNFKLEYLIDTTDLIIYKRTLIVDGDKKASSRVGVSHVSYHVFGLKKIGKYYYSFSSQQDGCEKGIAELMAKSIRSVKAKEKAKS